MARVIVLGGLAESLINFRGPLLAELLAQGHEVYASAPAASAEVRARLAVMGVQYREVKLSRAGLNPFHDMKALLSIYRLIRSVQPDFFLGYTIKPVIYGSLAARAAGVSRIFSMITGVGYVFATSGLKPRLVGLVAKMLYGMALRCNRRVFFQNPDDLDLFKSMGVLHREQAVIINGSGVDTDFYWEEPQPVDISFFLAARLLRDKGILEYVEAARRLRQRYPEVRFRLAGWLDENPAAILSEELQQWIDEGTVEYLGKLEDVRPAMAACTVYVLPSYREGTPRTVLEAMSTGRAIVTTDAPGCRETVIDGDNGFLVPVKDVDALEQAMERYILEPDLIRTMGLRSRQIAVEKYDVHKVNAIIINTMGFSEVHNSSCSQ